MVLWPVFVADSWQLFTILGLGAHYKKNQNEFRTTHSLRVFGRL